MATSRQRRHSLSKLLGVRGLDDEPGAPEEGGLDLPSMGGLELTDLGHSMPFDPDGNCSTPRNRGMFSAFNEMDSSNMVNPLAEELSFQSHLAKHPDAPHQAPRRAPVALTQVLGPEPDAELGLVDRLRLYASRIPSQIGTLSLGSAAVGRGLQLSWAADLPNVDSMTSVAPPMIAECYPPSEALYLVSIALQAPLVAKCLLAHEALQEDLCDFSRSTGLALAAMAICLVSFASCLLKSTGLTLFGASILVGITAWSFVLVYRMEDRRPNITWISPFLSVAIVSAISQGLPGNATSRHVVAELVVFFGLVMYAVVVPIGAWDVITKKTEYKSVAVLGLIGPSNILTNASLGDFLTMNILTNTGANGGETVVPYITHIFYFLSLVSVVLVSIAVAQRWRHISKSPFSKTSSVLCFSTAGTAIAGFNYSRGEMIAGQVSISKVVFVYANVVLVAALMLNVYVISRFVAALPGWVTRPEHETINEDQSEHVTRAVQSIADRVSVHGVLSTSKQVQDMLLPIEVEQWQSLTQMALTAGASRPASFWGVWDPDLMDSD